MAPATILLADDDRPRRAKRYGVFSDEGWAVIQVGDAAELAEVFDTGVFDLAVLDFAGAPGELLALAQDLRRHRNLPVIVVSGDSSPLDRVRLLEAGADDFIARPFHIRELILRMRRILRRYGYEPEEPGSVLFNRGAFDVKHRMVRHLDGTPINLTGMELNLLELFIRHPGRILSRDDISRALHGREWSPYDRTIDGHVARLRRKVAAVGEDGKSLIRSVRGVGYVFAGELRTDQPPA